MMRNLLALFGALVATFLVAGYFLGWYSIQTQKAAPGRHHIEIDGTKIRQDLDRVGEQTRDWINSKSQQTTEKQPDNSAAPTPKPGTPVPTPSTQRAVILMPPNESAPASGGGWWFPED